MTNLNLERVVRPYGQIPFNWGNVFETSIASKGVGGASNVARLNVTAKTSCRTTEIKGASWKIVFKHSYVETARTAVAVDIPNPDDPSQIVKVKAPKSITLQDSSDGSTHTYHYVTPDPADPLNSTIPASGDNTSGDWAVENSAPLNITPNDQGVPGVI